MNSDHLRIAACVLAMSGVWTAGRAAEPTDEPGRDFPKTLIFDEPGIDDEMSLPTAILVPREQSALEVELDKRLTTRVSLQLNTGFTALSGPKLEGWQDLEATLKIVLFTDQAMEQLVSLSLSREFGGSGAERIGASRIGTSIAAVNFGQGFMALTNWPVLKPVAVTGSLGYQIPDRPGLGDGQQAVFSVSAQYSFDVLGPALLPTPSLRPLIPIVECLYAPPGTGEEKPRGTLAPGLIYAGSGYQLAAEALIPLTRAAGRHVGLVAQLNISFARLGITALSHPLF